MRSVVRRFSAAAASPRARVSTLLLVLTALLLPVAPAVAQGRGDVEVVVSDSSGATLADVQIRVTDATGAVRAEGKTNKKGKYEVALEGPAASYEFTFEKPGLATETMAVQVQPGMTSTVTMTLIDQTLKNKQLAVETFNEAVGLIQSGNEREALVKATAATELDSELAPAYQLIALIQANLDDLAAAAAAVDRFLELAPESAAAVALPAYLVAREQGKTAELPPLREQLRAQGVARDVASNVYNDGVAAVRAENKEEAIAIFQEAIAVDPTLPAPYQSLAALHFNDQEYAEALPYLDQLATVAPENVEGQRMTFFSQVMLGNREAASAAAKRWFGSVPAAKDDLLKQAEGMFEGSQTAQAQAIAELMVEAAPEYGPAHYLLGRILAGAGKTADAKQHLQHFLDLSPDHPEAEAARQMLASL
ncbi:MAG TPA: carboxypeptidase regulatory-like domain-containing protein [Thermoanaerobaculia bacterium]|nr:carboxypeptidase regulatory-like domain-containing protein [Thermoanaerobaculia bacterium]